MTHHIILWKLKDELSDSQKADIKKNIKEGLEGLSGKKELSEINREYSDQYAGTGTALPEFS